MDCDDFDDFNDLFYFNDVLMIFFHVLINDRTGTSRFLLVFFRPAVPIIDHSVPVRR